MPCTWAAKLWCVGFAIAGIPFNFYFISQTGARIHKRLDRVHRVGARGLNKKMSSSHFPVIILILFLILFIFLYAIFTFYTFDTQNWPYGAVEWDSLSAFYVAFMQFPASVGDYDGENPLTILGNICFIILGLCMLGLLLAGIQTAAERHYERVLRLLQNRYIQKLHGDKTFSKRQDGLKAKDADRFIKELWEESSLSYLVQYSLNDNRKSRLVNRYLWYEAMENVATQISQPEPVSCQACQRSSKKDIGIQVSLNPLNVADKELIRNQLNGQYFEHATRESKNKIGPRPWKPKKRLQENRFSANGNRSDKEVLVRPPFRVTKVRHDNDNSLFSEL